MVRPLELARAPFASQGLRAPQRGRRRGFGGSAACPSGSGSVCGMGIAFFFSLNAFFGTVAMAYLPLPQHHQQGWYYQAFAPNFALSNYVAGRKSVREGADIQLAKMLAGPIPDDLRLVLDGGPGV